MRAQALKAHETLESHQVSETLKGLVPDDTRAS